MLKFLQWQLRVRDRRSDEVLATNTLLEMQRVHWVQPSWDSGWGLGFSVRHTEDRDLIGHGGSYPGYRTQTQLSPEEKVGVVVFTNAGDGNPGRFLDKAFEWVAAPLADEEAETVTYDPDWDIYVGTYRNRWGDTSVLRLEDELVIFSPLSEKSRPLEGDSALHRRIPRVPPGERRVRRPRRTRAFRDERRRGGRPHLRRRELLRKGPLRAPNGSSTSMPEPEGLPEPGGTDGPRVPDSLGARQRRRDGGGRGGGAAAFLPGGGRGARGTRQRGRGSRRRGGCGGWSPRRDRARPVAAAAPAGLVGGPLARGPCRRRGAAAAAGFAADEALAWPVTPSHRRCPPR